MRLIDNHKRIYIPQHLVRIGKRSEQGLVVFGIHCFCGIQHSAVRQKHVDFVAVQIGVFRKGLNCGRKRFASPCVLLLSVKHVKAQFRSAVERLQIAFHICGLQKRFCAFLNRNGRHKHDEFVYAVFLMKLEHRPRVNVGFSGSGFHLYIDIQIVWT